MRKRCKKCGSKRVISKFSKDKTRKDGLHPYCKKCVQKISKPWFEDHQEEIRERAKKWYADNGDRVKEYYANDEVKTRRKIYMKQYRKLHKERKRETARQYDQKRCKEDIQYKLSVSLRKRLGIAIRGGQKTGSAVNDLGCSVEFLKQHIESQFQVGMTWENWGQGEGKWQLDHIKPLCSFDLTKREQFLEACNYINLQPLWYEDHLVKTENDLKKSNEKY